MKKLGRVKIGRKVFYYKRCIYCGSLFVSKSKRPKLCSRKCVNLSREIPERAKRKCLICGTVFRPSNNNGKYCSQKCYGNALRKYLPRPCKKCGKKFTPQNNQIKFCSLKCSSAFDKGSLYHHNNGKYVEKRNMTCSYCGRKVYYRDKGFLNRFYCSIKCSGLARRQPEVWSRCKLCGRDIRVYSGERKHFCSREHVILYQFIFGAKVKPVVCIYDKGMVDVIKQLKRTKGEVYEYVGNPQRS